MSNVTESAVRFLEMLADDDSHGYDQQFRWGERGDYDCSAAVITAWERAGVPVRAQGASYTGNMRGAFLRCGFEDVTERVSLPDGAGLRRGDVLLNVRHHTALFLGGGMEAEASIHSNASASALSSRLYSGLPVAQSVATTWNSIGFAAYAAASKTSSSIGSSR